MEILAVDNLFNIEGKVAVITGASGLLGKVYVSAMLRAGVTVIAIDKQIPKNFVSSLIDEYGNNENDIKRLNHYKLDITDQIRVQDFFSRILVNEKWFDNSIDILINNASLVKQLGQSDISKAYACFEKQKKEDWESYFQVDLIGALLMVQSIIPFMKKKKGGVIVNISSTYGCVAPDQRLYKSLAVKKTDVFEKPIGYSISKSGVLNMTRHLAVLYAKFGVRVNTLTPGGVFADNPDSFVKEYNRRTPMNRMANRNELAGPMLFLVSKASSYMTGSNLIVDGGWTSW